jgi:hypothetical protein
MHRSPFSACLAIGALILHWGQFDSELGFWIKELRAQRNSLLLPETQDELANDLSGRLTALRRLFKQCGADDTQMRKFDACRTKILAIALVRDDIAHGATGLGNSTGTDEGIYLLCVPSRKNQKTLGDIKIGHHVMVSHHLKDIFAAADLIREVRSELDLLFR